MQIICCINPYTIFWYEINKMQISIFFCILVIRNEQLLLLEERYVYKIAKATLHANKQLKVGKQAQGSNQRSTAPLNPFDVCQNQTQHNGKTHGHLPARTGWRHLAYWDVLHLGASNLWAWNKHNLFLQIMEFIHIWVIVSIIY